MKTTGFPWIFKLKADRSFRARVVVQGWGKVQGVDCGGTFAPVCRVQSIRIMLAATAEWDWEVHHLDVWEIHHLDVESSSVKEEVFTSAWLLAMRRQAQEREKKS